MSRMRLYLIALGLLFVFVVWLYNKLQERRIQRGLEGRFASPASDILLREDARAAGGTRTEPSLAEPGRLSSSERLEPHLGTPGEAETSAASSLRAINDAPAAQFLPIDPLVHAVMTLSLDPALPGERWLAALHALRHAGRQSVVFEGLSEGGPSALEPASRYGTVRLGVQLASRSGALNEIEFSEFVAALQHLAESLGAQCEVPDMMETVAAARALDARCAPLDAMVGINIASPAGPWPMARVVDAARAQGMLVRSDQRLVVYAANGDLLFLMQDGDGGVLLGERARAATDRVTLLLEVPRVARAHRPFDLMQALAVSLAKQLDGLVVDDELRTLTEAALARIGAQIEPVYDQLEAEGFGAGSVRALTLFR